jgi:hypothetical protein
MLLGQNLSRPSFLFSFPRGPTLTAQPSPFFLPFCVAQWPNLLSPHAVQAAQEQSTQNSIILSVESRQWNFPLPIISNRIGQISNRIGQILTKPH